MSKYCIYIIGFIFYTSVCASAQQQTSRWIIEVGVGINSLRCHKDEGTSTILIQTVTTTNDSYTNKKHIGGHAKLNAYYHLGRHWRVWGGLGLTFAQSEAVVVTRSQGQGIFGSSSDRWTDHIDQSYFLLDVPLGVRWLITAVDKETDLKPFLDVGVVLELPIMNNSEYLRIIDWRSDDSGKLGLRVPSFQFNAGFLIGKNYSFDIGWTWLECDANSTSSTLTRYTISRSF